MVSFEVLELCVRGHVCVIADPLRAHCLETSQVPPNLIGHGCPGSGPVSMGLKELFMAWKVTCPNTALFNYRRGMHAYHCPQPLQAQQMPSLTRFSPEVHPPHLRKILYPNRNWIWVSSPPYPKALKHPPLLLCSPSLCQWHTSQWFSIQYKHKEILLCYYLHCTSLILSPATAPIPSQSLTTLTSLPLYSELPIPI